MNMLPVIMPIRQRLWNNGRNIPVASNNHFDVYPAPALTGQHAMPVKARPLDHGLVVLQCAPPYIRKLN